MTDLVKLVQHLGAPRVLVVGDVMLDRYVWGNAERISQEAPVILLRADKREERLGGASSVATMLQALGAKTSVIGVVGSDIDGAHARKILTTLGIDAEGVIADPDRPTSVKERYIGRAQARHPQQMIRVDYESREPVSETVERNLADVLTAKIREADIVLVSDYDKGVCTPGLLRVAIEVATKGRGIRVIADPTRGGDYTKYRGCSSMTPNRLEAGLATGRTIHTTDDALRSAALLRDALGLEAGLVTLDKDGMALAHSDGRSAIFPTRPRQVYDITGAGDMVMATLGLALAAGNDYDPAIRLANVAGGLEVEKIGVATVTRDEILADLLHAPFRAADRVPGAAKVIDLPALKRELETRRANGQTVAFTNGCFDVLHAGHVQYLAEARLQADCLVVALNSDESVRHLKGPTRPLNPVEARALVLAGLQDVDYVTIFCEATPAAVIEAVRPDVLVKGADYRKSDVVGAAFVESYGGRVHLAGLRDGFSTTNLIERMKAA
jgi:D-beta-D-heptose 7-phosphate kinase / D-beta-D-heptose 1-phosphate adenosyltransferase